ncbi:sodium- and chloride-dependent glycine transporter 2 [Eurytemora carolleeae]|uniref:sodium- and chloride-dependent glycine transporter 2 n=1 Tax=Eurytemora carolleeae TaxID=1294199 RepID=UPI000C777B07|nr:sodium- and chloride-dependent glycine transporter 2 [Eurytemora carolleeae]XP_023323816.1 sodium- and chloride-dependent glycine transporter 2 [Eurytemora carolleeae]|eukprot:XP_023323815.1 sodium- and chloride-dependent glycine transporter 2-like [Eurytemora affinis]
MRRVKGSDENKIRSWGSRGEFLVSCIGYTVGIGNIVQFPFLVFRNGGAAFLVPYLLFLVVVGMPMYFMEAAIGQFAQGGVVSAFYAMLPASTGVGVAMVVLSLIVCIYYNILLSYCLFYLFQSFRSILPWSVCDETWGADQRCFTTSGNQTYHKILLLEGQCLLDDIEGCSQSSLQSSAQQFWNKVLLKQDKKGLEKFGDIGSIDLNLAFCLLLTWISVTVIVVNGVKISRKISYSTALFPYILLFILLVRGLTLEGSTQGLRILFNPKWSKLEELSVWRDAALQVFYSLGLSWGGLTMLGSFNKFNDRIHIDTQIVPIIDFFTSIVASIVVFSLLGHREHSTGVSIQETVTGEQALAFISIPEALEQIPTPNLWSIIFFLMLFILGLNCQYVLFEVILTTLKDLFPMLWSHQEILTCLLSTSCFLLGLPCISEKGQRVLEIMDLYGTKITVIIVGLVELLMVMWLYGVQRFCRDIKCMVGVSPGFYFQICWSLFCPLVLVILIIFCLIPWSPTAIIYSLKPDWALKIGWSLFGLSLIQIPGWFIAIFFY